MRALLGSYSSAVVSAACPLCPVRQDGRAGACAARVPAASAPAGTRARSRSPAVTRSARTSEQESSSCRLRWLSLPAASGTEQTAIDTSSLSTCSSYSLTEIPTPTTPGLVALQSKNNFRFTPEKGSET